MTLPPTAFAAMALAAASPQSPLVERMSEAMRGDMPFCETGRPALAASPVNGDVASPEPVSLRSEAAEFVECAAPRLAATELRHECAPGAPSLGLCSGAFLSEICPGLRPDPVPVSLRGGPCVASSGVRCIADRAADGIRAGLVFDGLCDGSLSPRMQEWRPPLLDMLAGRVPAKDFDRAFDLLLGTFPGSDSEAKTAALLKWAEGLPEARDAADICRALTRHYIAAGECELAIAAADSMLRYHAGYLPNALYLKGHALAFAGRFDESRRLLVEALSLKPVGASRARILYLQAWMLVQDGDTAAASKLLEEIASAHAATKYARQARAILDSLGESLNNHRKQGD